MAASRAVLSDDVRSVKLILLLVKGGTLVAKKLIIKILDKSIDDYLKDNEDKLKCARKKKHITEKQMNILFPGSLQPTDLDCWDISLFSYILLNLFDDKLECYEKVAIKALRDKRNDMSHLTSFAMSEVQLMREWTHLTKVLFQLSRGLTTAEEEDINDTFVDILTITDFNVAKQKLEPFEGSDELLHQIVTEKLVSHDRKFEEIFNFMDKARASNETVDIMARILVNALTPAEGDAAQAELLNALKQIVFGGQQQTDGHNQHDEQYQTGDDLVLIATKNIVSDIKDNGVDIVKVEKGSILVTIRCPTISALKNISQYLANRMYEERLEELEIALSKHVGSPVKLNISIVLETLDSALMQIEKDANNKSIVLQLKCRGSEGVKKAVDYFYNGSSTNAFNSLSEALSRSVDNKIELHTEIDVDKLEKDINTLKHLSPVDGHHSAKESAIPIRGGNPSLTRTSLNENSATETLSSKLSSTETPPTELPSPQTPPTECSSPETPPTELQSPQTPPDELSSPETPPTGFLFPERTPTEFSFPETTPSELFSSETPHTECSTTETQSSELSSPQTSPTEFLSTETPPPTELSSPETPTTKLSSQETQPTDYSTAETPSTELSFPETPPTELSFPETHTELSSPETPPTECPSTETPPTELLHDAFTSTEWTSRSSAELKRRIKEPLDRGTVMSTEPGDIRYCKILLLLCKGGTLGAKKIILKLLKSDKKCIDVFLKDNVDKLDLARKKKHITDKQLDILFPLSATPTDLECWDRSLLFYILLNLFDDKLESYEKTAITELRDAIIRLAHSEVTIMSEKQFFLESTRLTLVLFELTRGLTPAEQDEINDTVNDILAIQDFTIAKQQLKLFEDTDEFVKNFVSKMSKSVDLKLTDYIRCVEQLEDRMKKLEGLAVEVQIVKNSIP